MTWSEKLQRADKLVKQFKMAMGSRDLVFVRCGDLAQELTGRDLHFVVEGVVLSYHQVRINVFKCTFINRSILTERIGETFIHVSQAMVVPHSPLLLALLGRANEKEQIVYLEGVTSEAVRNLLLL